MADTIGFSTFVSGSGIAAVEGGNASTIAFTFAGSEFVGSVYLGPNNNQLYSTDLSGGNLQKFGAPIPGASGEVVVGASLGQAGFASGDIYTGSQANGQIYHFGNGGGTPTLFATLPGGDVVRQIFFDPGSSFGGDMLVATSSGHIYRINSAGVATLLAAVGEDAEGMDIATGAWGPYAGDLLVGSEGSGNLRLISPSGVVTLIAHVPGAETISFVPPNLDASDPLQGFYVANYPFDIQFAAASVFTSQNLQGDAIVTNEFGGSSVFAVHYDSSSGTFSTTAFTLSGNQINQFEDGIFVTPQRITESAPEPGSVLLLGAGLLGLLLFSRRRLLS
ncbi:MAG: PEP-CTERM sorting domain-containing protein [Bryobacteraceae bacterium]